MGMPSSVALLLAGVLLGPNALGVLDRDPTIILLGTVGLLYIMFLAGLEIDLQEFIRHKQRSLVFGVLTFALPQFLGAALGRFVFDMGWTAAILLGSVFASHTLLAYPAVARLGLQKERSVTTAVGATILTDTLALLVLAVIASSAQTGTGLEPLVLLRVVVPLVVFGVLVLWGLPRIGAWFLRRVAQDATVEFVFILSAVFVCALIVELLGVEAIIGAFLAGLALNRLVPEGGALMNRIGFFGNALFIPFFLLSTGMLVDLGAFVGGADAARAWTVAGAMVAAILITKGLAAWLTRPAFDFTAAEAQLVYGLTVPQAAATLAAVLVGVEVGLFDDAVLNGTIAMVSVTCLLGPWLVEAAGRRLLSSTETQVVSPSAHSRLLVSVVNPATVAPLIDLALLAREPSKNEPLVAVTVAGSDPDELSRGEHLLSTAVMHAAGASVPVLPLVRSEANVARALAQAATETRSTTLLMGWDGGAAAERLLFGSILDRVLNETDASVLIARATRPLATVNRLVVALPPLAALAPGFERVVRLLTGFASRIGASLVLLTPAPYLQAVSAAFERVARGAPKALPLSTWSELPNELDATLRASDALVLVSARQGEVAWRASLERLPRVLARRFPELPLLVLYPGQAPVSARSPSIAQGKRFLKRFGSEHIRIGLTPGPVDALLRQILPLTPAPMDVQRLFATPLDVRHELRPGVLLFHAHTQSVEETLFAIGVSREGLSVAGASGKVFVVAALAVPAASSSATYLEELALVTRMLQSDTAALRKARTPESIREILLDALRARSLPERPVLKA